MLCVLLMLLVSDLLYNPIQPFYSFVYTGPTERVHKADYIAICMAPSYKITRFIK